MLRDNKVIVTIGNKSVPYNVFKDVIIRLANLGINQKGFTQQVLTNNAREFVQFLIKMKDDVETIAGVFSVEKTSMDRLYHRPYLPDLAYSNIKDKKVKSVTHGVTVEVQGEVLKTVESVTASAFSEYDSFISSSYFSNMHNYKVFVQRISDLYKLNTKRYLLYRCAENDFKCIQKDSSEKYFYKQHMALRSSFFDRAKNEMYKPNPEHIMDALYVSKNRFGSLINKLKKQDIIGYLVFRFFVHDDYYSSYQTKYLIVAGKFFELMVASLDPQLDGSMIKRILYSTPFNANIAKNRYVDEIYRDPDHRTTRYKEDDITEEDCNLLAQKIIKEWQKNAGIERPNPSILCTHFIHTIANKYFNNVNILKLPGIDEKVEIKVGKTSPPSKKRHFINGEDIYVFMQRLAAIFMNSVASFESTRIVVNTNIALSKDFSYNKLFEHDNAYIRNIYPLLNNETFTNYYDRHPVMLMIKEKGSSLFTGITIGDGTTGATDESVAKTFEKSDTGGVPKLAKKTKPVASIPQLVQAFADSTKSLYYKKKYQDLIVSTITFIKTNPRLASEHLLQELNNGIHRYQRSIDIVLSDESQATSRPLAQELKATIIALNNAKK